MKRKSPLRTSSILIIILFYSSVVGFTSDNGTTEKTWLEIAAGLGSYSRLVYDCSGQLIEKSVLPFTDLGVMIQHTYGVGTFIGRAGVINGTERTVFIRDSSLAKDQNGLSLSATYIGGALGVNFPYIGIEVGALYFRNITNLSLPFDDSHFQPVWKLRIGYEDSWYFSTSLLYNTPLVASGGMFDMGLGFRFSQSRSSFWIGIGAGPYYGPQLIGRWAISPMDWKASILLSGNIGTNTDAAEYGISVGVRWQLY